MAGEIYLSNLSGQFDYQSILDKYQELKNQQIAILQEKEAKIYDKKYSYQNFSDLLDSFNSAFEKLTDTTTFDQKSVFVSDESVLTATVTDPSKLTDTSLNITSNQLAKNDVWLSQAGVSDKDTTAVATAAGTIELSYAGNVVATINYDTDTADTTQPSTLQEIADSINNSQSDIRASVFFDGTNYRLLLSGADTGANNTITITETGSGDLLDQLQLGSSYTASNVQTAQNAQIDIYGQTVESSTNTFDSVIDGLRIDLLSTSATGVDLTINEDYEPLKTSLTEFIDGYNSIVDFVQTYTAEDGPLSGDFTLQQIRSSIFDKFDPLFEMGVLSVDYTTGKITLDNTEFDNQLQSDPDAVKTKIDELKTGLGDYLSYITGYDSPIEAKDKSFDNQINNIEDSIESIAKKIDAEMENLKKQFVWLDQFMAEMNDVRNRLSSLLPTSTTDTQNQ
ncbi:flagellar filament capping protein FliD [Nitrosophilus alvini]|uniref:flagellar filament capping protein FliD n=1 Tax=Nitrosophilus alvini TaxID=2714855 RepID=UPI00190D443A|nr:flagellar filament capping protein FliD [Nitrosophilus alvini]